MDKTMTPAYTQARKTFIAEYFCYPEGQADLNADNKLLEAGADWSRQFTLNEMRTVLKQAERAIRKLTSSHRFVHSEKCYPDKSDDTNIVCNCGIQQSEKSLSQLRAAIGEEEFSTMKEKT